MPELEQLLVSNLPLIERLVRFTCRECRMSPQDIDDFSSYVKVRLIEDDYGVLRKFGRRCALSTYLAIVVRRMLGDYRNHLLGKWRNSREAENLGPLATRIETLIARDHYSADEAFQVIATSGGEPITRSEFDSLIARLPRRRVRSTTVPIDDAADELAASATPMEDSIDAPQRSATAAAVTRIVDSIIEELAGEDRTILRLHFNGGARVADISRALHLEHKPLYRRLSAIYGRMRERLHREGIGREQIEDLIGRPEISLDFAFEARNSTARPSIIAGSERDTEETISR